MGPTRVARAPAGFPLRNAASQQPRRSEKFYVRDQLDAAVGAVPAPTGQVGRNECPPQRRAALMKTRAEGSPRFPEITGEVTPLGDNVALALMRRGPLYTLTADLGPRLYGRQKVDYTVSFARLPLATAYFPAGKGCQRRTHSAAVQHFIA